MSRVYSNVNAHLGPGWYEYGASVLPFCLPFTRRVLLLQAGVWVMGFLSQRGDEAYR